MEKEQFFADLDALDHLDDDDEVKLRSSKARTLAKPKTAGEQFSRKRKPSSALDDTGPPSSSAPTVHEPPRPSTSEAAAPFSTPVSPPALRRTQSETSRADQKQKRGKANKDQPVLLPADQRIFNGLVFFFIPNNAVKSVRKLRINNTISRGATWASTWQATVTHVVVDKGLDIHKASTLFPDGFLPPRVAVVTDEWPIDCIKYRTLSSPSQSRFRVPGMSSPFQLEGTTEVLEQLDEPELPTEIPESEDEAVSPHDDLKAASRQARAPVPAPEIERPKSTSQISDTPDELDNIIAMMQKVGSIPDSMYEDDSDVSKSNSSFSSSFDAATYPAENRGFLCMELNDGSNDNPNAATMDALQLLATHFDEIKNTFRSIAYRRARNALSKQKVHIRTYKQAIALPYIGESIAAKIEEFVETNRIRRLDYALADPMDKLRRLFMGVYGAGYVQAQRWIAQGHRTLEDLKTKADLTPNQKVGLEHYDDFQQRIARQEVAQHAAIVQAALKAADPELEAIVGGSYRRGNSASGDIDILITKKGASMERIRTLVMDTVVPQLEEQGFLKVALASTRSLDNGSKWHGASALPGNSPWRRLDLLFVPADELGAALLYFTGNDIFNRSLRLLASRKKMRLNQHGLLKNVLRGRGRVKLTEGELVEGRDERKIFEILGVPYRPPEHRKC